MRRRQQQQRQQRQQALPQRTLDVKSANDLLLLTLTKIARLFFN
jgi:hypothetical protein